MREVHESNDVIYTFSNTTEVRVWLVVKGGGIEELTDSIRPPRKVHLPVRGEVGE